MRAPGSRVSCSPTRWAIWAVRSPSYRIRAGAPASGFAAWPLSPAWGSVLLMGVTDPLGGINTLFPLFGIANQLLAAIALTVVTVVVIKKGLLKWAWIPAIPLLWDLVVTLTASWQKIFSADPAVGYWTQHHKYLAAKHAGKTAFGSAKNAHQLDEVIRNTFIQGTLSIIFALVVVIVFIAGVDRGAQGNSRWRQAVERRRPGAVEKVRAVGPDCHRRRARGAKRVGRARVNSYLAAAVRRGAKTGSRLRIPRGGRRPYGECTNRPTPLNTADRAGGTRNVGFTSGTRRHTTEPVATARGSDHPAASAVQHGRRGGRAPREHRWPARRRRAANVCDVDEGTTARTATTPRPRYQPKRYAYIENAAMARAMERL